MCSVKSWPLANISWYFNNVLISNENSSFKLSKNNPYEQDGIIMVELHLEINNITQNLTGVYTCLINGNITAKNYTLLISSKKGNKKLYFQYF